MFEEIQLQLDWLDAQQHEHKIVIAGNHDILLDDDAVVHRPATFPKGSKTCSHLRWGSVRYLQDESTTVTFRNGRKLNIYGCPLTPQYGTWAFQYLPIRDVWKDRVPKDVDILMTHGPPKGHLDNDGAGCPFLLQEIHRVKPRLAVFGHIHAGRGQEILLFDDAQVAFESIQILRQGIRALCRLLAAFAIGMISRVLGKKRLHTTRLVNAAVYKAFGTRKVDLLPSSRCRERHDRR